MTQKPRILGLDYGSQTVGVAVSDQFLLTASPLETIMRPNEVSINKTLARLSQIIRTYDIRTIVLGYPINMDGSEGFRCARTNDFRARLLRNFNSIEVILWDERLSTVLANRYLKMLRKRDRERVIDQAAASVILQSYLDYLANAENDDEPENDPDASDSSDEYQNPELEEEL